MDEEPDGIIASIKSATPRYSVAAICAAISEVYSHPYFGRIWVQQEVVAVRNLVFRRGDREFTWKGVLADPSLLLEHHEFHKWRKRLKSKDGQIMYETDDHLLELGIWYELSWSTSGSGVRARSPFLSTRMTFERPDLYEGPWEVLPRQAAFDKIENVLATIHQGDTQLRFLKSQLTRPRPVQDPDLIQSLLGTGIQKATNTRDFVYGILSVSRFPYKHMSQNAWLCARVNDTVIPVDYSLDLGILFSIVTWAVLMQGGLGLVAKFKLVTESSWEAISACDRLPSWAMDWRLTARLICDKPLKPVAQATYAQLRALMD